LRGGDSDLSGDVGRGFCVLGSRILSEVWVKAFALVLANRASDGVIVVCGGSRANRLAEGPNGCGLVVLDVEEAVHLGDLEQVVDPLAEVHHL
jgi:hypothetical protein